MVSFDEKMPMPRLWYKGKRKTYANAHQINLDYQDSKEVLLADPQQVTKVSIDWSKRFIRFCVMKRPQACHYYSKKSFLERKLQTEVLCVEFDKFDEELEFMPDCNCGVSTGIRSDHESECEGYYIPR